MIDNELFELFLDQTDLTPVTYSWDMIAMKNGGTFNNSGCIDDKSNIYFDNKLFNKLTLFSGEIIVKLWSIKLDSLVL